MHTEHFVIDGQRYVWAPNGQRMLASEVNITHEKLKDPVDMKSPKFWAVTRQNGELLFVLRKTEEDKKKSNKVVVTALELNRMKIQWFEPLADQYRELLWVNTKDYVRDAYRWVTWQDVVDFSLVDRFPIEFASGEPGDWKTSEDGANGFILVMVDEKPYWADAVGQIPYAIDTYRMLRFVKPVSGIGMVVATGTVQDIKNFFTGKSDTSNEYDNYFILRGALYAKRTFYTEIQLDGKFFQTPKTIEKMHSIPAVELGNPITKEEQDEYAIWDY